MSLINEALKKAQRQRSGDQPFEPGPGAAPLGRVARREKPMGFNFLVIRFVVGCVLTVALLLGGYYLYLRASAASETPAQPTAAATPLPAPATTAPTAAVSPTPGGPAPQTPALTTSAPTTAPVTVATPPPASSAPLTVTPTPPPAATTASTPLLPPPSAGTTAPPTLTLPPAAGTPSGPTPAPAVPAVTKPAAPTKMDPRAIAFIEGLRVSGIRASSTDSKVLMNDRVYRAGDTVEHELGLKLVVIRSNSLTFENEAGLRYTRNF